MKLWLISQSKVAGYDSYDSAVVAAETQEAAQLMHPGGYVWRDCGWGLQLTSGTWHIDNSFGDWPAFNDVTATLIGDAAEGVTGVICASFNAG
jgi:hypothetical protein